MSKEQTSDKTVQSREQVLIERLRLMKKRSRTHRVGNLVLLTNKNNEDKSNFEVKDPPDQKSLKSGGVPRSLCLLYRQIVPVVYQAH